MDIFFEWDEEKNKTNIENHGISFSDAINIFFDKHRITGDDNKDDYYESREISIGRICEERNSPLVIVSHTNRENKIRIISARKANKKERSLYYAYYKKQN